MRSPPPHSEAQTPPAFPPDFYDDFNKPSYGLWENTGWVADTYGELQPGIQFVTEGAMPRTYIKERGEMSFVLASVDTSVSTLDTLRRLDLKFVGELAQEPNAIALEQQGHHKNFYLPHCGTGGVTDVHGYNRIVYPDMYPGIDIWVYSGQLGQKMMIVIHPGANPDDLLLQFTGQDDMDVDLAGWLRLQIAERWIVLPEAVAYQYDANNVIIPLNWTAAYDANTNNGLVGFEFETYDSELPLVLLIGPPPVDLGTYYEDGLCWSTYFSGEGYSVIHESETDINNWYYVAGYTSSSLAAFPSGSGITYAAIGQVSFTSGFDPTDQIIWTTFLGGTISGYCETHGLVSNADGTKLYVGGYTDSDNFCVYPDGNAYYLETSTGSSMSFVARLDPSYGFREWATYLSTGTSRLSGMAMAHNTTGERLYVTGWTLDDLASVQDPISTNPFTYTSGADGYLVVFNENDRTCFATYLGGDQGDQPYELRSVQNNGIPRIVLAGITGSSAIQAVPCSGNTYCFGSTSSPQECFLMEFDYNGNLVWSTFLNTPIGQSVFWDNSMAIDELTGDIAVGTYSHPSAALPIVGPGWHQSEWDGASIACMIHPFAGSDHGLNYFSYLNAGVSSNTHIRVLDFDDAGVLTIAGQVAFGTPPLMTDNGVYFQPVANPNFEIGFNTPADPFVLRLSAGNELLLGTFIGGYGQSSSHWFENIYAISSRNDQLYVAGCHAKHPDYTTSYFPLDQGSGVAYFSDIHFGTTQGFIASLCSESPTSTDQGSSTYVSAPYIWLTEDEIQLSGLSGSVLDMSLFDLTGRLVRSHAIRVLNGTAVIPMNGLGSGNYLLTMPNNPPIRLIKP